MEASARTRQARELFAPLGQTYDRYALTYIQRIPAPKASAIGAVKDQIAPTDPRVAALRLEDVIDASIVGGLETSGFYTRLYGD